MLRIVSKFPNEHYIIATSRNFRWFQMTSRSWYSYQTSFNYFINYSFYPFPVSEICLNFEIYNINLGYLDKMGLGVSQVYTTVGSWDIVFNQVSNIGWIIQFTHFQFQKIASTLKFTIQMWVCSLSLYDHPFMRYSFQNQVSNITQIIQFSPLPV